VRHPNPSKPYDRRIHVTARRLLLSFFAVTAAACGEPITASPIEHSSPAFITNGVFDNANTWPAVGAMLIDRNGDGIYSANERLCTGTLISPTHFVTAAHCLVGRPAGLQLAVSFDANLNSDRERIFAVSFTVDERYPNIGAAGASEVYDLAIVTLPPGSTAGVTPMQLPTRGLLTALQEKGAPRGAMFVNVGYGVSATSRGPVVRSSTLGFRMVSSSPFMALTTTHLGLLMNSNATGEGGDCNGDSGGPKILDHEGYRHIVLGTLITGDAVCRATSWNTRLDTDEARSFLGRFVALP
jgi:secreted trypsin-like serine protease